MRLGILIATVFAGVSVASSSFAQNAGPGAESFGLAHQLAISNDADVSLIFTSPSQGSGTTDIDLRPAADYFVIDNLSVGGLVEINALSGGGASLTTIGLGPRVGYSIPFNDMFSVWLKGGFTFLSESGGGASDSVFQFNINVPFLLHPAQHFFVGLGPKLDIDLSGDNKVNVYGLAFTLGGWIGL